MRSASIDRSQARVGLEHDAHTLLLGVLALDREHALDDVGEQGRTQLGLARSRVLQKAGHDAVEAIDLAEDDLHEAGAIVTGVETLEQHLRAGADTRERVADLVRHTGRELPQRGETLMATQLLLHAVHAREVGQRHEHRRRLAESPRAQQHGYVARTRRVQHGLALERGRGEGVARQILAGDHRAQHRGPLGPDGLGRGGTEQLERGRVGGGDTTFGVEHEHARLAALHEQPERLVRRESGRGTARACGARPRGLLGHGLPPWARAD